MCNWAYALRRPFIRLREEKGLCAKGDIVEEPLTLHDYNEETSIGCFYASIEPVVPTDLHRLAACRTPSASASTGLGP